MNNEQKIQKVRELLLKYTTPRPQFTGFNAWTIAEQIVETITCEEEEQNETSML